jgi:prephenate dehydratase
MGRNVAEPLRVAVQGEPGCFSHAAALGHFGALELVACLDFPDLFAALADGRADRACVPVENALAGAVIENLDLLVRSPVTAVAEAYVRVEMCLAARPGTVLEDLVAVGSHPVALRQCRRFLRERPGVREVVAADTAGSIRALMDDSEVRWNGAIGPALAADLYGAEVLARGIEDHPRNFTRFLIVAQEEAADRVGDPPATASAGASPKASLAFTLPHRPGALYEALGVFAEEGLDLTRLESRPIPGHPWEYRFYADVRGTVGETFERAVQDLRALSDDVRVIGRYAEVAAP